MCGRLCCKSGWALPQNIAVLPVLYANATMHFATTREHACWQGLADRPHTCPRKPATYHEVHSGMCAADGFPPQLVYCAAIRPAAHAYSLSNFDLDATSSHVWPCATVMSPRGSVLCKNVTAAALSASSCYF
jgi:hypothetical protein